MKVKVLIAMYPEQDLNFSACHCLINLQMKSEVSQIKVDLQQMIPQGCPLRRSSRIPKLQQLMKHLFPAAELLNSIHPGEVFPIRAASKAGILTGKEREPVEDSLRVVFS